MNKNLECKINASKARLLCLTLVFVMFGYRFASAQQETAESYLMVRIAELEIDPAYLEEYQAILAEEAAASVKLEPGVIAIFPMYKKGNPTSLRILEIYADPAAYESHLQTPHFQHYKTATLKMVKSLKLVDMESLDKKTMSKIFKKLNDG